MPNHGVRLTTSMTRLQPSLEFARTKLDWIVPKIVARFEPFTLAWHRGTSVIEQVRLYSPRALGGRTSRSWFATMGAWCQVAPSSWPSDLDWSHNERFWFRHYIEVERIVLQGLQPECVGTVHDWGCRGCGDHERAQRLGLIPVRCEGETRNDFYARPTMRRREEIHTVRMRRIRRSRSLSPSPRPLSTHLRQRP